MKRLIDGLIFGTGFSLAFILIFYLGVNFLIVPQITEPQRYEVSHGSSGPQTYQSSGRSFTDGKLELPYHELAIEDQITHASAIALAKYQPGDDGRMKAVITAILKKDKDVAFYCQAGDEYSDSSYYPRDDTSYGEGLVIFFSRSPATKRMSMGYSGERITSLGDMSLKLFREKCELPSI